MKFFTSTLLTLALSALASAADSAPHIYNISRPLTEISRVLDLGKGIKPPSSGLVPTRRGTNAAQRPQDGVMCMDPPYGYPNVRECNELCHVFLEQPTRKLTINPVSAINWMNGECEFGIANLDPCSPQTIEQGILSVWCLDLLAECVVEQLDGYYDLSGYRMAAALTVDDATPPRMIWLAIAERVLDGWEDGLCRSSLSRLPFPLSIHVHVVPAISGSF